MLSHGMEVGLESVVEMVKEAMNHRKATLGAPKKNRLLPSDIAEVEAELLAKRGRSFKNLFAHKMSRLLKKG